MAQTNISPDKIDGEVIQAEHVNELKNTIITQFVGRNSSGTPESGQELGTISYPWGVIRGTSLVINSELIDFSTLTASQNRLSSGKVRSTSDLPDFIRATGSTNSATVQGATTNLVAVINGTTTTLTSDIVISSLTVAGTGAANECSVNDTSLSDQLSTKYLGDGDSFITVDNMGANISAKVGSYVCLKASTEYMLAYVESTTKLSNIKRGFFFDSSGNPVVRETLANNDTLSLMSLGWVFFEDNATTFDVTYNAPIYSFSQPSSPSSGDYWFDLNGKLWKRYNGTIFEVINRVLVGLVVIDSANCIASRSIPFDLKYNDLNSIDFPTSPFSTEIVKSIRNNNVISVNANQLELFNSQITFDITSDLDSGVTEASSTTYYMYITQDGNKVISDEKPYSFDSQLQGQYHPYQSWRYVGEFFNNSSSNIDLVTNIVTIFSNIEIKDDLIVKRDSTLEGDATINGTLSAQNGTESLKGLFEIATQAETDTGTDDERVITPAKLQGKTASTTAKGIVELLTNAEMAAGTDTTRAATAAAIFSLFNNSSISSSNGYIRLPIREGTNFDEIIIQFAEYSFTGIHGNSFSPTFPLAFPNACRQVIAYVTNTVSSSTTVTYCPLTSGPSKTGFTFQYGAINGGGYSTKLRYIAIGY